MVPNDYILFSTEIDDVVILPREDGQKTEQGVALGTDHVTEERINQKRVQERKVKKRRKQNHWRTRRRVMEHEVTKKVRRKM